jgi:hypothetical protein
MSGNRKIHSVAKSGKERKYLEETAAQHADGSSEAIQPLEAAYWKLPYYEHQPHLYSFY